MNLFITILTLVLVMALLMGCTDSHDRERERGTKCIYRFNPITYHGVITYEAVSYCF